MRRHLATAAAAFISSALCLTSAVHAAGAAKLCEREMARAAIAHDVPLAILYAVGLSETGRGNSMSPYALNIEGEALYDLTKTQAIARFSDARKQGAKLIDVGCLQINHHFHKQHFASVADMLDPRRNVDYGAKFLAALRQREGTWTMAVARYHAGPANIAAQKRYVCRVLRNMAATGMASWTADASALCGAP